MTLTQSDKAKQFRALHEAPETFVRQEFTHMMERPSAEWRLPARLHPFPFESTRVRGR